MDLQITGTIGLMLVLVVATSTMALADESFIVESFFNPISSEEMPLDTTHGHVENFTWIQRVSIDGGIEISGINFVVINDDDVNHSFQICTVIEGPVGQFTPSFDSPPACTNTETIKNANKSNLQIIEFSQGVKVSDLVNITISIQEMEILENSN
jgi:hypothetical protein